MGARERTFSAFSAWIGFLTRQPKEWKVTATRTSLFRFFYQMVLPYISVYTLALGASGTELGMVNSIGMGVAGLLGPLTGWIIDRIGNKVIYLIGIALIALAWLLYSIAQSWTIIIAAMLAYWIGFATSMHSCSFICSTCVANKDRATAMSTCETLAAGLLGMLGPMLGAFLVSHFGGVNVEGIRPLFYVSLAGTIFTFFLVLIKLPGQGTGASGKQGPNLLAGISEVFTYGKYVKRFIIISSITFLPQGMIVPFTQAFAEVKGADSYILGAMVTGCSLTPFLLGLPMGRLADRIGRKKVIYAVGPLIWASNLILILASRPLFLILAGILQGFIYVNSVTTMAMAFELLPREYMGRWMGITRFFRMALSACLVYVAGAIWDKIGPAYLFWVFIGIDMFIRIPLLISVPETIGLRHALSPSKG